MRRVEEREAVTLMNDGAKMFGVLHRPLISGKFPAVIFCHGYAGNKSGRNRLYVTLAERLAEKGFIVLRFDFRGSGDSEGEFKEMTINGEVQDTLCALDYLSKHPQVDPRRIGILGRSLGGAIAVLASKSYGAIKSISLWAPLFDTKEWHVKWNPSHQSFDNVPNELRIGGELPNRTFLEQFFHLDVGPSLQTLDAIPLLHIHGECDSVVKIHHADEYVKAREHAKGATRFIRLPESDHDFSHAAEQKLAIDETCRWFEETLI